MNDYYTQFMQPTRRATQRQVQPQCGCQTMSRRGECDLAVMAFVPEQSFEGLFDAAEALSKGTLFCALYKPFEGRGCCGNVR